MTRPQFPPTGSLRAARSKQPLSIPESNALGLLARQLRQPAAVFLHDRVVRVPALVDPGVGPKHEPVGVAREQVAPFRCDVAATLTDAAAIRQLAPQRGIRL